MRYLQRVAILAIVLLLVLSVRAFAMSQSDFVAYVSKEHTYNGIKYQITAQHKRELENFLKDNPITEAQADEMKAKFDSLVAYAGSNKIIDPTKATYEQKQTMLAKANEIAAVVGVSVKYNSTDKTLEFYKDGKFITAVPLINGYVLAQTGSSNYAYLAIPVAVGVIALAGFVVLKKRA